VEEYFQEDSFLLKKREEESLKLDLFRKNVVGEFKPKYYYS